MNGGTDQVRCSRCGKPTLVPVRTSEAGVFRCYGCAMRHAIDHAEQCAECYTVRGRCEESQLLWVRIYTARERLAP